ncbi:hypothetical protein SSPO_098650 [Streptomyces antimycoticus]|uniref:Uncharacterized protein n=1 Tax=Streptomyces antimycoticus TaxID=68175 RepID=A0A499VLS3_9ACTN|nr:hypothetical protein SSPO_098650 [Streptomyces antimycoticus]
MSWADIEAHHPGIDTLRLPEEAVDGWKQRLLTYVNKSGEVVERRSRYDVMMRIRGFYLDIQEWAHEDPFWAEWACPSPIRRGDGAGNLKAVAQTQAGPHAPAGPRATPPPRAPGRSRRARAGRDRRAAGGREGHSV